MTVLVVAVALAASVIALRQVLLADVDRRIDASLEQEANEFTVFLDEQERDPGESPQDFALRVLERYLRISVTDPDESMTVIEGGSVRFLTPEAPASIGAAVDEIAASSTSEVLDVETDAGDARVLTQPVLSSEGEVLATLAIAWFPEDARGRVDDTIADAALVAAMALALSALLAWVVAGRLLRPVGMLADTARQISETDLDRRLPVQGSDEIASLIGSFNSMVDRLQDSLSTQRRFLDDAGHELRTPITIIQGHLELAGDDATAFADSREVVLAELARMNRIVDDLLTLARAERLDFLDRHPVDLDEFTERVLDRARSLGEHDWHLDGVGVGVVEADADRLLQAMLNLVANAVRHTPAGGRISIGSRVSSARFELWVADAGEGIDPADHARIFDRFARPTETRSPGGSAGLGLSIVRAVAEAHGGDVRVDSTLGHGATFTIRIPLDGAGGATSAPEPAEGPATRPSDELPAERVG